MTPPAEPRFAAALAIFTYLAAALVLGLPALGGGFLVNANSDQYIAGYALREFGAQSLRAGHGFPMWNPYLFGGMPFVAAMNGDIFYPTFLLRMLLPTDVAMTWGFILHVFLAGCFMFLFLRGALRLCFAAALVGGLAYMMGGNVAGLVSPGHDGKLFVAALLPLVLFFVYRGVRDGRAWAWGALAAAVMLAVLSPHPQLLQYLLLTAGAYALFVAFSASDGGLVLPRATAVRRLGLAAAAVAVGMLGGAIQFWPLLEYTSWSPRAGGKGWEHAVSYSLPPEELLNTYLPQFSGILERYSGRNLMHLHSEYIGAAVLVLAGLAFGARLQRRSVVRFWTGVLVVSALWAMGGFTPFFHLVYALVPGTKFFRAPSTMLYVVSFCTAVLAAIGTERALTGAASRRYLAAWLIAAVSVALLASGGILSAMAMTFAHPRLVQRVDANATALVVGAWRSLLMVVLTVAALWSVARGRMSPRMATWGLAAIVALDLWSVERLYWRFSPRADQLYASDAVIDYLKRQPEQGRVLPLAIQPLSGEGRDPYFGGGDGRATGLMVHGIRSVVGYHGNELARYDLLTGWDTDDYLSHAANPNLWRLLNVRYIYTNVSESPIAGARLVAGPARNVAGNVTYLYALPEDNPAAWVTSLAVKASDDQALAALLNPRFDVRRVAIFDSAAAVGTQPVPHDLPPLSGVSVRTTRPSAAQIVMTLDRPAPPNAALVVSENYYPGWEARVDGRAMPVSRADYVLSGLVLPAGAREIVFSFTSPRYQAGKAITLAAMAIALLALLGGIAVQWRDARRRHPAWVVSEK